MGAVSIPASRGRTIAIVVGSVLVAALALWVQNVVVPYSKPFWGLFDNQLDLDVYRAGAQTVLDGARSEAAKAGIMPWMVYIVHATIKTMEATNAVPTYFTGALPPAKQNGRFKAIRRACYTVSRRATDGPSLRLGIASARHSWRNPAGSTVVSPAPAPESGARRQP